ncbi:MAG TPA: lipopolysaccharide biosynthesis protein [Caulobacteraceae bacterium]|jgi:O-antigen/teichoic acid export membrane protein|nr:lipopolysaccharide biosynthesis protein [Caulobacteraceae bacterium]
MFNALNVRQHPDGRQAVTVSRRIVSSFLANGMGKIWIVLVQLVTVPVVSVKWGPSEYGIWLMLSTVPTYVALSSFGFGTAAAVDMTRHHAFGNHDHALRTFQSVWLLVSAVLLVIVLADGALWVFRSEIYRSLPAFDYKEDALNTAIILVIYSVITVEMSYLIAGYQSTGRYAEGTFLYDLTIPIETCALIAACLYDGRMSAAALAMTVVRIVAAVAYYIRLRHHEPWIRFGWSHASLQTLKRLAHPALASMSMTLSTALSLQGLTLSLGLIASPAATAAFATARTVTRIPLQLAGLSSRATLPEMTRAFSRGDKALSANLIILNLGFTAVIVAPFTLAFVVLGPYIVEVLSRHRLHASRELFTWLALVALLQAIWTTIGQFLFAINKQHRFAYHYLVLAGLTAAAPVLVGQSATVTRSAIVWCAAEAIMLVIVYRVWWTEAGLDYTAFVGGAARIGSRAKLLALNALRRQGDVS